MYEYACVDYSKRIALSHVAMQLLEVLHKRVLVDQKKNVALLLFNMWGKINK